MDSLREIFDAMNSRIRSPIFGSIAVMFIIFNWKPLFYLAFAHKPAEEKFQFFDANVTLISGLVAPIALGVLFAIASPWIALFSAWLAEAPTTRRKLRQTKSTDKILTEKLRLDQTRNQLLASEERALIDAAKRDEEVKEIEDPEIRDELKREIEQLRIASSNAEANLSNFIRVWTHLIQHLMAKRCSMDVKFRPSFSNRVASLRMSFILQKNRSTMFRMA